MFRLPTTATAPFCPSEVRGSVFVAAGAPLWQDGWVRCAGIWMARAWSRSWATSGRVVFDGPTTDGLHHYRMLVGTEQGIGIE